MDNFAFISDKSIFIECCQRLLRLFVSNFDLFFRDLCCQTLLKLQTNKQEKKWSKHTAKGVTFHSNHAPQALEEVRIDEIFAWGLLPILQRQPYRYESPFHIQHVLSLPPSTYMNFSIFKKLLRIPNTLNLSKICFFWPISRGRLWGRD